MDRNEAQHDATELLDRAAAVAETLCLCAPYQHTRELRDGFAELGKRLAELVAIGRHPGGADVVASAIRDAFSEVDRLADKVIRYGKN